MASAKVFSKWCIVPLEPGDVRIEGYTAPSEERGGTTFSVTEKVIGRLDSHKLKCAGGDVVEVQGAMEYDVGVKAGIPTFVLNAFKMGFPYNWTQIIRTWTCPVSRSSKHYSAGPESSGISNASIIKSLRKCSRREEQLASNESLQSGTSKPTKRTNEKSCMDDAHFPCDRSGASTSGLNEAVSRPSYRTRSEMGQGIKPVITSLDVTACGLKKSPVICLRSQRGAVARTQISETRKGSAVRDANSGGGTQSVEACGSGSQVIELERKPVVVLSQKDRDACKSAMLQEQHSMVSTPKQQGSIQKISAHPFEVSTGGGNPPTTESRHSSPNESAVPARRQVKALATQGHFRSVLKTAARRENVTSEETGGFSIMAAIRTRNQTKVLEIKGRTGGPSVLKATSGSENMTSDKAEGSSTVTATRTRKQAKMPGKKDHKSDPSVPKTAPDSETMTSEKPEGSSTTTAMRTRKRTKMSETKDHMSGPSVPKKAPDSETMTSEKAEGSSSTTTAMRTRKRTKTSETKDQTSDPSVLKKAPYSETMTPEKAEGSSTATTMRTRKQRKMPETKDHTSGPSVPKTALHGERTTSEQIEGSSIVAAVRTRKRTKTSETKDQTSDPSVPKKAPDSETMTSEKAEGSIVTAIRTTKRTKVSEMKDHTSGPSVPKTTLHSERTTSEQIDGSSIVAAVRTRKRTKTSETKGHTSDPSVPKKAPDSETMTSEKAEGSSTATTMRTRKQTKMPETKDHTSGPSVPKTALHSERTTSEQIDGSSIVAAVRTGKRTKTSETKDHTSDSSVPKKAPDSETMTSEKAEGSSIATAMRTRKQTKMPGVKVHASGSSVPKAAPHSENMTCDNLEGPSIVVATRTRNQTKMPDIKDRTSNPSVPKTAPGSASMSCDKIEGCVAAVRTRKRRKALQPKNRAGDSSTMRTAPQTERKSSDVVEASSSIPMVTRRRTKVLEEKNHLNDPAALKSASHIEGTSPAKKQASSSIMKLRTRRQTEVRQEKSDVKDKPDVRASSVANARATRSRTKGGESIPQAAVNGDENVDKNTAVKLSTNSRPAFIEKTKSKVASKEATRLALLDETLRGPSEPMGTTAEDSHEETLQPEAPRSTRGRAAPAKLSTVASTAEIVPCSSKQPSSNVSNHLSKGRQARQTRAISSNLDEIAQARNRRTVTKPKKALLSSSGSRKGGKGPDRKGKDVTRPEMLAITARKGTLRRKAQVRRVAQAVIPATADDVFAADHGVQQTKKGPICDALVQPFGPSDEELEVAGTHTPSLSSLQCTPTRSSFSDSRSSLSSADVHDADKDLYRMERRGKKEAAAVLTSTPIMPKRKIKRKAFLTELNHAEKKMLDLEERGNFENMDTELDYFSDLSSTHEAPK